MVLIINITMILMESSEVHDGQTTARTCIRASLFLELTIIIRMVERSGASDHYRTWHEVRLFNHNIYGPIQYHPTCGMMKYVMRMPSSMKLLAIVLNIHPHIKVCLVNTR